MPVLDLASAHLHGGAAALGPADVVIVGSGPAGSTLARELSGTHLKVVVLESGSTARQPWADALNEVENVGRERQPDQWSVRNRILGGSSHTWGGRCTPFDDIDFARRTWVPGSGWPVTPEALQPYLERSATHLGLAAGDHFNDDRFWRLAGRVRPGDGPDEDVLLPFQWQFSRDTAESYPFEYTRFGRHIAALIAPNVTLVTSATVVRIDATAAGDAVRSIEVAAPDGSRSTLVARVVVLAAGGIENARLLLASTTVAKQGLGNDRGLVGRYLMDHPRGIVGTFELEGSEHLQKRLGRYQVEGRLFRAGFRLSPGVQQREQLLNCASWLGEELSKDDPWAALRRVITGHAKLPADATDLVRNLPFFARGARDYFVERNGIPRKLSELNLVAMVEQRPDPDSRITLADRADAFGVPLSRIDWHVHPEESRTVRRTAEITVEQLRSMGLPVPRLLDSVRDGGELPAEWRDVAHPTGTTRMSADAATGVVDADGQVHGITGLYVTGSSVFPTAGHGNPTQLIVAMAARLADHLRLAPVHERIEVTAAAPPTVVLTGARGRIGRVVLDDLLERGYTVRATTSSDATPAARPGLTWHRLDLVTAAGPEYDAVIAGADAVLHLAAEIGAEQRMTQVNTVATRSLAESAERAGVRAFCYTSTVSVYGSGKSRTAHEEAPVLTVDRDVPNEYLALPYVRAYGRTKLAGELALRAVAKTMRVEILRPAVVVDVPDLIGIREWSTSKRLFAAHRHAHHVYVRDVSDALIWTMERALAAVDVPGRVEVFNVAEDGTAEPTHAGFLRRAFRRTGDPRFRVPPVPGAADWAHDLARFRGQSLRNPLWRMRFPVDKLLGAGWRHPYGMGYAQRVALDYLLLEATGTTQPLPARSATDTPVPAR